MCKAEHFTTELILLPEVVWAEERERDLKSKGCVTLNTSLITTAYLNSQ